MSAPTGSLLFDDTDLVYHCSLARFAGLAVMPFALRCDIQIMGPPIFGGVTPAEEGARCVFHLCRRPRVDGGVLGVRPRTFEEAACGGRILGGVAAMRRSAKESHSAWKVQPAQVLLLL